MKRFILLMVLFFAASSLSASAQRAKETRALFNSWDNYEIEQVKTASSGVVFVKVWGFGKRVDLAINQAKKNAVHACIFRGIPGEGTEIGAFPALVQDPNVLQRDSVYDYFSNFFYEGKDKNTAPAYIGYVNMTTDGEPTGQDRRSVKGGYKVAIYCTVLTQNLRKKLQADGIIVSLKDMF